MVRKEPIRPLPETSEEAQNTLKVGQPQTPKSLKSVQIPASAPAKSSSQLSLFPDISIPSGRITRSRSKQIREASIEPEPVIEVIEIEENDDYDYDAELDRLEKKISKVAAKQKIKDSEDNSKSLPKLRNRKKVTSEAIEAVVHISPSLSPEPQSLPKRRRNVKEQIIEIFSDGEEEKIAEPNAVKGSTARDISNDIQLKTPRTPSSRSAGKRQGSRTPKRTAKVISVDEFPIIVQRTPSHHTPRSLNPSFSAPAGQLRTPSTPTVYSAAKALFQRGSQSTEIIGRTEERGIIERFLIERLTCRGKGALYLSGLPGTGKSALLNEVLEKQVKQYSKKFAIRIANINCMTVGNSNDIFTKIHQELTQGIDDQEMKEEIVQANAIADGIISNGDERLIEYGNKIIIDDLERRLLRQPLYSSGRNSKSTSARHIIVLDELDHIMTKDQEVLYRIFQWAFADNSSLILFGIANALDLTDRFLPRLRSISLTPQLLAFKPYTATEITSIIEDRLWSLDGGKKEESWREITLNKDRLRKQTEKQKENHKQGQMEEENKPYESLPKQQLQLPPLMHPAAIQLCARKTASNTGDLRKAFDLCRRAIETVEEEFRRQQYSHVVVPNVIIGGGGDFNAVKVESTANYGRGSPGLAWKRALVDGSNCSRLTSLTLAEAPRVSISHMAKVCTTAFGGTMAQRIKTLNVQQKAVLCVLVMGERQLQYSLASSTSSTSSVPTRQTIMRGFERYIEACNREKVLSPLPFADFLDVVSVLEANGVLSITGVCGRRGLGGDSGGGRYKSGPRGGSGANSTRGIAGGIRDDYSQRGIKVNVHQMDLLSAVGATPLLRTFLVEL